MLQGNWGRWQWHILRRRANMTTPTARWSKQNRCSHLMFVVLFHSVSRCFFVGRFSQTILPVSPSTLHHITKMPSFESPLNFSLLKFFRSDSNMTNLHAELRVTLTENGIPDTSPLLEYMDWAGIRTKNSLAMFFTDTDKITEWIEKFQNEITFGTAEKKIHFPENDRRKGLQACFIAAWHICRDDFNAARQSKLPAPSLTPSPSIPTATASTTDDKIPKAWPKGVYQQLLTDYRTSTGNTRSFPEKILIGAEKIIVRMWHEHTTSKNYQAVGLGEIITNRTFTATGSVNNCFIATFTATAPSPPSGTNPTRPSSLTPNTTHLYTKNKKTGTLSRWWWSWTHSTQSDGPGSSSKYQHKRSSTTTLRGSSNLLARIPNAYQMSKRPGTPSHGRSQCDYATTSPSSRLQKRSSKTQSPSPTSSHNQFERNPDSTRTRARSKAKAKARPRTNPTRGSPNTDNNPTPVRPTLPIPSLLHLQQHNQHTHMGRHHSLPHIQHPPPRDNTKARRASHQHTPKAEANNHRNRDSTATGMQQTSQLTDLESKPCCKASSPTDPSYTFHSSPALGSHNWP